MNPTDEARLDWSEDGPDEADVLADNEVLAAENARLNTENDSLRKLVEAMREEVVQSILLNSDYARERDQARDQRDDARTRADAFAKELTEIAEVLPSRPMMLGPDGTVTPTGSDRLAGQVRAIVAERDELRAKLQISVGRECNALCLDLERDRDQMRAAIITFLDVFNATTRRAQPAVDDAAATLYRTLGVTDE